MHIQILFQAIFTINPFFDKSSLCSREAAQGGERIAGFENLKKLVSLVGANVVVTQVDRGQRPTT